MTRALDPDYEDRAGASTKTRATLVDFSTIGTPDPSTARLVRVVSGYVDKVDFGTDLSDLLDFSISGASAAIIASEGVRVSPSAFCTQAVLDYNWPGGLDLRGRLVQSVVERETIAATNPSGFPAIQLTTDYSVGRFVNQIGSTYPTVENQDSSSSGGGYDFSQHADAHPMILDMSGRRGLVGYVYPDTSTFLDFGAMSLGSLPPTDPITALTLQVRTYRRADNNPNACVPCEVPSGPSCLDYHVGTLMWRGAAVMANDTVCLMNAPEGVGFDVRTLGVFPIMDTGIKGPFGTGTHPAGGVDLGLQYATYDDQVVEAYANGLAYPYQTIKLRDNFGGNWSSVSLDPTGPDGVWGGDCYRIEYDQELTRLAGFCDANVNLDLSDYGLGSYIGLGRQGLVHDPIDEDTDMRAQAVGISLPAIDLDSAASLVAAIRANRNRAGIIRIWSVHYDNETGTPISEPLLEAYCYANSGPDIEWQPPSRDSEGEPVPGGARITMRPTSRIAGLDRRTGITMSTEGVQTYYPGETCYDGRKELIGKEIPWGR